MATVYIKGTSKYVINIKIIAVIAITLNMNKWNWNGIGFNSTENKEITQRSIEVRNRLKIDLAMTIRIINMVPRDQQLKVISHLYKGF